MADDPWSAMDDAWGQMDAPAAAPKAAPKQAPARPRGMWDRLKDNFANAAEHSLIGAGVREAYARDLLPDWMATKPAGWDHMTTDQRRAAVANASKQLRSEFEARQAADPAVKGDGVLPAAGRVAADVIGGVAGGVDPTYLVAPGRSVVQKIAAQEAIQGATNLGTQEIEKQQGVRDEIDPWEAMDHAVSAGAFTGGSHVVGEVAQAVGKRILPVVGRVTSGFGHREAPKAGASSNHMGVDIAVPVGTPVEAPAGGTVVHAGHDPKRGNYVEIDHGNGYVSRYFHLTDAKVGVGDEVAAGQTFARSGRTGNVTGPHLHWSVLHDGTPVDPMKVDFGRGAAHSDVPRSVRDYAVDRAIGDHAQANNLDHVELGHRYWNEPENHPELVSEINDRTAAIQDEVMNGPAPAAPEAAPVAEVPTGPSLSRKEEMMAARKHFEGMGNGEFKSIQPYSAEPDYYRFKYVTPQGKEVTGTYTYGGEGKIQNFSISSEGGPRSIGPAGVKKVLAQLKETHPEMTGIEGFRISGARQKGGSGQEFVDLPAGGKRVSDMPMHPEMDTAAGHSDRLEMPERHGGHQEVQAWTTEGLKARLAEGGGGQEPPRLPPEEPPHGGGGGGDEPPPPGGDEPPAGGDGEGVDPEYVRNKLRSLLADARPLQKEQARIYARERAERFDKARGAGKDLKGKAAYHAELAQLKGALTKKHFESIEGMFSPDEVEHLFDAIKNSPRLTYSETLNARNGMQKILEGTVPADHEIKLLAQVFSKEIIDTLMKHRPLQDRLAQHVVDAMNIPRAFMASMDLSAPGRQGIGLVTSKAYWTSLDDMLKGFSSEARYNAIHEEIMSRPSYRSMRKSGLFVGKDRHFLNDREEQFMSNLAEKVPGAGRVIRASERAYSAFLEKLRADHFDFLIKSAKDAGVEITPKLQQDLAKYINTFTGRGDMPRALEKLAPGLNAIFFSPRLIASRIQMLNPLFYTKLDPFVRKQAMKSLIGFAGTQTTLLSLAALVPGVAISMNMTSPDFGKARIGNTRIDTMGGFQQYLRFAAQMVSGTTTNSRGETKTLGEGYKADTRKDILYRFLENKEAPIVAFATKLLSGKDPAGKPIHFTPNSISDRGMIIDMFVPMVAQDTLDAIDEWGVKGTVAAVPAGLGAGVQTYKPNAPKGTKVKDEMSFGDAKEGKMDFSKVDWNSF